MQVTKGTGVMANAGLAVRDEAHARHVDRIAAAYAMLSDLARGDAEPEGAAAAQPSHVGHVGTSGTLHAARPSTER